MQCVCVCVCVCVFNWVCACVCMCVCVCFGMCYLRSNFEASLVLPTTQRFQFRNDESNYFCYQQCCLLWTKFQRLQFIQNSLRYSMLPEMDVIKSKLSLQILSKRTSCTGSWSLPFDKESVQTKKQPKSLIFLFFLILSSSFCFFPLSFYHSKSLGSFQCAHMEEAISVLDVTLARTTQ